MATKKLAAYALASSLVAGCQGSMTDDLSFNDESTTMQPLSASQKIVSSNPYVGAEMYINPDYVREVEKSVASTPNGSALHNQKLQVKSYGTAIWLDSRAAITGGSANQGRMSLVAHLNEAVKQANTHNKPVVVTVVIYDLPDRDCAALASNGELKGAAALATYKSQYIDKIRSIFTSSPDYAKLRLSLVMEPDSLPNLVTNNNPNYPVCQEAASQNIYVDGVTYAIQKLGSLPNTFIYLDIGHSAWLGWPSNMNPAVSLYSNLVRNAGNGDMSIVRGFADDIANYTPFIEPYLDPSNTSIRSNDFYQWNPYFDELHYIEAMGSNFANAGFTNFGFITDTSRSGWKIVNNGQPIDRRPARGNWCNVNHAGLGARPQASPGQYANLDAFVWVKPPGESDGVGTPGPHFDGHCDPSNPQLDVVPGAPQAGEWFEAAFTMLVENATPPLTGSGGGSSTGSSTQGGSSTGGSSTGGSSTGGSSTGGSSTGGSTQGGSSAGGSTQGGGTSGGSPSSCNVNITLAPAWQTGNGYATTVNAIVSISGGSPINPPWQLSIGNSSYTSVQSAWNWTAQVSNGQLVGTASASWETLVPGAAGVNIGAVVQGSSPTFTPTSASLNGTSCQVCFK